MADERSLDGWLSKMTTLGSGKEMLQRRWFVLQGNTLSQYNSHDQVSSAAKWSLDLTCCAQVAPVGGDATRM